MKWKVATVVSATAFLILLLIVVGSAIVRHAFGLREYNSSAVLTQVQRLNQLVTVKYSIQRVVGLREPKIPIGEESVLLMVQGEALAGIDVSKLKPSDIAFQGRQSVVIALPQARLLNVYIDEKQTKVWDHEITWWTPWVPIDPDLEHKARMDALDNVRKAALQMGILDQAETNAESAIRDLLSAIQLNVSFKKHSLD